MIILHDTFKMVHCYEVANQNVMSKDSRNKYLLKDRGFLKKKKKKKIIIIIICLKSLITFDFCNSEFL